MHQSTLPDNRESLAALIDSRLLPQAQHDAARQLFIAAPQWQTDLALPPGMSSSPSPIRGKRVPAQRGRPYGNTALIEAHWPEDNLQAARTPKLTFILSFPTALQIADYIVHCQPGHCILVPPGIPFSGNEAALNEKQDLFQLMAYQGGMICWRTQRWVGVEGEPQVRELSLSIPRSEATHYLNRLAEEAGADAPHAALIQSSLLQLTLAVLSREISELPVLHAGKIYDPTTSLASPSLQQLKEYIERHLREPLTIAVAARYVCMSRTIFTAWFRSKTGQSFSQYVQDLRFETACKLLRGGDLGIRHIAAAVGLQPNRMRTLFRERTKLSPREYRQQHRSRTASN